MPIAFNYIADVNRIVDSLPAEVSAHMFRVGRLVDMLSQIIGNDCDEITLPDEDEPLFYGEAAYYHDIGKAFIPVNILKKPGRFTGNEMEIMKKHTVCAQVIFEDLSRGLLTGLSEHLIVPACNAALYHHEWWNGQGYPFGLRYEEIPMIARLTSICDAYDAITGIRSYRPVRSHEDACGEIRNCSGTQFDPAVAYIFLKNETKISYFVKHDFLLG